MFYIVHFTVYWFVSLFDILDWCHWCCVTIWCEVGTCWNYTQVSVHHIYHFRLTASPSAGSVGGTSRWLWSMGRRSNGGVLRSELPALQAFGAHLERCQSQVGRTGPGAGKCCENQWNDCGFFMGKRLIFKRKIEKIQAEFMKIHGQWSGMITWFGNQLDANGLEDSVRWEQKECYGENWAEGKDHDECMKEGIHSFPTVRFFSNLACRYTKIAKSAKKCAVLSM